MANKPNLQTFSSLPSQEMQDGKLVDQNSCESDLNRQSPSRFPGFGFNPGASKQAINHSMMNSFIPKMDIMTSNPMLKIAQDVQAVNFEFEDSTARIARGFEKYETGRALTANYYPDSTGITTPQTSASSLYSVETGQNSAAAYNAGGMANQELVANYYAGLEGQKALLDNYYQGGGTGSAAAAPYYGGVKTGPGFDAGLYQGLTGQELANWYQRAKAGRASSPGNYQEVRTGQASVSPSFSELETGPPALLEMPNSVFGSQQKKVPTLGLPAGLRADLWPKELEDFLMAWKKANYTFPEISAKMLEVFGVERSVNVLSKRYRMILERDAENNGLMHLLKGATPKLLRVLEEEMEKMGPEIMDEELRQEVWEELQRRLPKMVRTLALQTRMGA